MSTSGVFFSNTSAPGTFATNFYGVSSELTVPNGVPEIDPAGMGSVLALVSGTLGLLERKRSRARG